MSRLFITSSPGISTLEGYVAEVRFPQYMEAGILQTTKAKCRELARSAGGMLVSPTLDSLHVGGHFRRRSSNQATIWIVAKMDFLRDGSKVMEKLSDLDITLKQKVELSHIILETCYKFTAIARLAPKWNVISTWLVQGSEFFSISKAPGLEFEVAINITDITLHLNTHKLSFSILKPDDLGLTPIVINNFKINPNFIISEKSITANRCLVLPNLTTAFIYSASHHLPTSPEFPTYDKLRLHWKKQHGMILPDIQEMFYQVYFAPNSQRFFSYPGCCVLKSHPLVYPSPDPDLTTSSFLADLKSRFPTLCGSPLTFSARALTPANLNSLGSGETTLSHVPGSLVPQATRAAKPNASQDGGQGQLTHCQKPQDADHHIIPPKKMHSSTFPRVNNSTFDLKKNKESSVTKTAESQLQGINPCVQPVPNTPVVETPVLKNEVSALAVRPSSKLSLKKRAITISNQCTPAAKKQCSAPCSGLNIGNTVHPSSSWAEYIPGSQSLGFTLPQPHLSAIPVSQSDHFNMTARPMPRTQPCLTPAREAVSADVIKKIEKSTIGDLKAWLNRNKIKFRSKDKKSDLVLSVTTYVSKPGSTFP